MPTAKFRQNKSVHCGYSHLSIYQDDGCPPSWICFGHICITPWWSLFQFVNQQLCCMPGKMTQNLR